MSKTIYYKATKLDGTDFRTGTVDYATALVSGGRIKINGPTRKHYECCTADVLHAADVPTETLIGCFWPCRLFEVTGRPVAREGHKLGFRSLKVERETEAHAVFGPQGRQIAALIEAAGQLSGSQPGALSDAAREAARDAAREAARDAAWEAARDAARDAAREAARDAAWEAARDAAWGAAWGAAREAAWGAAWGASGLLVRDLIGTGGLTQGHYDTLTRAWREVVGPLHEDDADLRVAR